MKRRRPPPKPDPQPRSSWLAEVIRISDQAMEQDALRELAEANRALAEAMRATRDKDIREPTDTPPKPPPVTTNPGTYREQRAAKKNEAAARKVKKLKAEDDAFRYLKDHRPKSRKACERVCLDNFKIGPQGAKRIYKRLRKVRKPATKRKV